MRSRKGISKDLVAALLARLEPSLRFRFSLIALGRAGKAGRDATHIGRDGNMAARLRPAKTQQYRREALPVAEGKAICTARLRPVQGVSIMLQDRRPFLRDHFVFRYEKPPDLSPR